MTSKSEKALWLVFWVAVTLTLASIANLAEPPKYPFSFLDQR